MKKVCIVCGAEFETNYKQKKFCSSTCKFSPCVICGVPTKNKKTCSAECKGKYLSITQQGENNPNFGNTWSHSQKVAQSCLIKSKVNDNYRKRAGSANRGKTFSKERISAMHDHRSPDSYGVGVNGHSAETLATISKKSKAKFTDEYKQKFRLKMEELGYWIPTSSKSDYAIYFKDSNWIAPMFDIMQGQSNKLLIEHGVFNAFNNTKGVVRDHAFSRRSGFEANVFPEIMRHPENCNIILHADNVRKNTSATIHSDSITLNKLFHNIQHTMYTNWVEHEICLQLIKDYQHGKQWFRKEV